MGLISFIQSLRPAPIIVGDLTWGNEVILMGSTTVTFED
jgi:hypothetical protein